MHIMRTDGARFLASRLAGLLFEQERPGASDVDTRG